MVARQAEPLDAPRAERRDESPAPTPSNATADRITATEATPEREAGLPSVLVDAPLPVPRVAQEPNTAAEGELLRDMVDLAPSPPRGDPAEATVEPSVAERSAASAPESANAATGGQERPDNARELPEIEPGSRQMALNRPETSLHDVPAIYRARMAPDRSRRAEQQGATPESELAVREGLKWLAANQDPDGRWNARRHGAGREMHVNGEDRRGAGINADTGMTGLALLAFLAAGNTHDRPGPYQDTVQKGLDYLLRVQKSDGNLSGDATAFAAMYCHAMAAFALSEAHAMTGDARLERHVRRAVDYIIDAQDRRGGGWRYEPGDPGDTSLLGWQLMALKSAELGGTRIPDGTRNGALRFLASVSSGPTGGLAGYRPGHRITRPMTAEALVCRQLLGMPPESPTATEAADYLMGELPGEGQVNLYYWYYATLGLYQLQGEHWVRWNRALQNDLVARQRTSGEMAGSWDPTTVWGGYGGRVYSTALATLCLQVYYRYVPVYLETAESDERSDVR
ncbi:MAG TPA: squalene--hopene cyclase [Planctomycetaceae bacterium]|nr:squalene--hopene cyclase [Planctomycetaceae bacterium]